MKTLVFFSLIFILYIELIHSLPETRMPIDSTSSFNGMFVRRVSSSEVIFGNKNQEMNYNPDTNTRNKLYKYPSICTKGSVCPLLMFNGNTPSYMVSKSGGKVRIVDLLTESVDDSLDFALDVRSMSQYNNELCIIGGDDSTVAKKSIHTVNVRTHENVARFGRLETNDIEGIALKNGQVLEFTDYSFLSQSRAIFMDVNLDNRKPNDISRIGPSHEYFKSVEMSNQRLVTCMIKNNDSQDTIKCFSGSYTTNSYSMQTKPKEILTGCTKSYDASFTLNLLNEETAIVSCGGSTLKLRKIDYYLNPLNFEMTVSNYDNIEFTVLNEYKLIFTMAKKENSVYNYYQSVYYFPYCVSGQIYTISSISKEISTIFSKSVTGSDITEHTKQMTLTTLPTIGNVLKGSSSVSLSSTYQVSELSFISYKSGVTSFKYYGVESSAFSGSFKSNECSINIIICYESCLTCSSSGTESQHNCNVCDNSRGFYREDNPQGNCITKEQKKSNYYLDESGSEKTFRPCYDTCGQCSQGGNELNNNCEFCKAGYVFISTQPSNCIPLSPKPDQYYLGTNSTYHNVQTYYPCQINDCRDCNGPYNTSTQDVCLVCMPGFSFFEMKPGLCVRQDEIPSNTYYDNETSTYRMCHGRCELCSKGGNDQNNNCDKCIDGYSFIVAEPFNCITQEEKEEKYSNYYLDNTTNTFMKCHDNCKTCFIGYNETDNHCDTCIEGFSFLIEEIQTKSCFNRTTSKPSNFYWDEETNYMRPCYSTCGTCSFGGEDNNNNCTTCISNYFFTENTKNCILNGTQPTNYYFDPKDSIYKECFYNCGTCSVGGNSTVHHCDTCKSKEYAFIFEPVGNCILKKDKPSNYYYDEKEDTFKECFNLCSQCSVGGDTIDHNCDKCVDGYSFSIDKEKNCFRQGTQKSNYYLDTETNTYRECYSTCTKCSFGGVKDNHNCTVCEGGLEWTTGDDLGNCLSLPEVESSLDEINQFLPILVKLKDDYDIKVLQVKNNSNFYYYSTKTIFTPQSSNISYVSLGECENILRNHYGISSKDSIFIAQLLYNNDKLNLNYNVYDNKGKLLDISLCENKTIGQYYPLIKTENKTQLINQILSYNSRLSSEDIIDLYDPSSSFYTDICSDYNLEDQDIPLAVRQDMYNNDLTKCPSGCTYKKYSTTKKTIECQCDIGESSTESNNTVFNTSEVKQYSVYLFKCGNLLGSFPSINKTYIHWFTFAQIGGSVTIAVFFFMSIKNIAPVMMQLLKPKFPGCPTNNTKRKEKEKKEQKKKQNEDQPIDNNKTDNFIEMSDVNNNNTIGNSEVSNSSPSINDVDSRQSTRQTTQSIFGKSMMYEDAKEKAKKNQSFSIEELNLMSFLETQTYDKRKLTTYFKDLLKQKLLFISLFTYDNFYYPIYLKLHIHLFTLILLMFFNSLLFIDDPFTQTVSIANQVKISTFSVLISFCIFKAFDIVMSDYCEIVNMYRAKQVSQKQLKKLVDKIVRNVKIKSIIIFSISFSCSLIMWYYLYIFGIIKRTNQGTISIMTLISLGLFFGLQCVLAVVVSTIRVGALLCKSNLVHMISKFLYYLI